MSRPGDLVVLTHAAADQCAKVRGGTREQARIWLDRVTQSGEITDRLPRPYTGRRSPSGYFLLVPGTLILPLATDRGGSGKLIATGCTFFPSWRRKNGLGGANVDPFALQGEALVDEIDFTGHAVERFQERGGGHRDPRAAREQLRRLLTPDAHVVRKRPAWDRGTEPADFLLVGGDGECCLPLRRHAADGRPFAATTFLHQSMRLFELSPAQLARACRYGPDVLEQAAWLTTQIAENGTLSWHPPPGHPAHPSARFYLRAGEWYLPVDWDKRSRTPLVALAVHQVRLPLLRRISAWLLRFFSR